MLLVSRNREGIYLRLTAAAKDDIAGLPKAACINRTKASSVLLFVGTEWYGTVAARAYDCFIGNATCHKASRFALVSSTTISPLYVTTHLSSVKVARQPALHKSEIERSDSDKSVSLNRYTTSGMGKFGRERDPTLCA